MPSESSKKANEIFRAQKGSCSQAIFTGYSEELGLGKADYETSMKIASAFSGGIARTGNVCGAVTGALMILGLKYGGPEEEYNKINEVAVQFLEEFQSINGTTICRDLINHSLVTEEDLKQAYANGSFDMCSKYVEDVTVILDKMLGL